MIPAFSGVILKGLENMKRWADETLVTGANLRGATNCLRPW